NQFINEIQTGTGTDADITQHRAGGALYNIHSDAASSELAETFPLTPGQLIAIGGGGKAWTLYHLAEIADFASIRVQSALVPGLVVELPPDGGDSIMITVDPLDPKVSHVTLISTDDHDMSPAQDDLERINILSDES